MLGANLLHPPHILCWHNQQADSTYTSN